MSNRCCPACLFLAIVLSACAGGERAVATGEPPLPRTTASPEPSKAKTNRAPEGPAPAPSVALAFRDQAGQAVVGRAVVIVDGRGARRRALTDEEGGVVVDDVASPYDVVVEGAPNGRSAPTVLLGLPRDHVAWRLDEHDVAPPPPGERIRVALRSGCPTSRCDVWVTTSSASGTGETRLEVSGPAPSDEVTPVDVTEVAHVFTRAALERGERVRLRVLVASADRSSFRYASVDAGAASPGDVLDLGTIEPLSVATADATVTASADDLPGWSVGTGASLAFDDGAVTELAHAPGAVLRLRHPVLPDGALCARAWAERPYEGGPDLHAGAQSRACALADVSMVLAAPLDIVAPRPGDGLSARGLGLRWTQPEGASFVDARIVHEAVGRVVVRVLTSGAGIPLDRLDRLGIRLPLGAAVLDVASVLDVDLEAVVDPERREDRRAMRTSRRLRFVVTP